MVGLKIWWRFGGESKNRRIGGIENWTNGKVTNWHQCRIGINWENWHYLRELALGELVLCRRIGIDGSLAALNNLRKLRSKEIMQLRN